MVHIVAGHTPYGKGTKHLLHFDLVLWWRSPGTINWPGNKPEQAWSLAINSLVHKYILIKFAGKGLYLEENIVQFNSTILGPYNINSPRNKYDIDFTHCSQWKCNIVHDICTKYKIFSFFPALIKIFALTAIQPFASCLGSLYWQSEPSSCFKFFL